MSKKLYESYLARKQHPFIEFAESVKDLYCGIHNKYCVDSSDEYESYYLDFKSAGRDYVTFEGEETWSYGGYKHHYLDIPSKFFINTEEELRLFEKEQKDAYDSYEKEKENLQKEQELAELQRLKEKYGE